MTPLNLTIVADRNCATSRAYLTYLHHFGYQVRKILLVDFIPNLFQHSRLKKSALQRLPRSWINPWIPKTPTPDPLFQKLCDQFQTLFSLKIPLFGPFSFENFGEEVEMMVVQDYDDPRLLTKLTKENDTTFLYTNGGRVPQQLLASPNFRMLHIHPGVVPEVRGSDGLLWSLCSRGQPGASIFYMAPGIDEGALIATYEFTPPAFPTICREADPDDCYRALLFAYDPHLRAQLLINTLKQYPNIPLNTLPTTVQNEKKARSYFAMHPLLRNQIMHRFCHPPKQPPSKTE